MSLTPVGRPKARTERVRASGAGPIDSTEDLVDEELLRGTCPGLPGGRSAKSTPTTATWPSA
ncbi:hypothetical protein JNW88_31590 [Micromonospora sp. ATA32]|nr:hypothetical protein [Micromonospora sp. ATA32]